MIGGKEKKKTFKPNERTNHLYIVVETQVWNHWYVCSGKSCIKSNIDTKCRFVLHIETDVHFWIDYCATLDFCPNYIQFDMCVLYRDVHKWIELQTFQGHFVRRIYCHRSIWIVQYFSHPQMTYYLQKKIY